MPAGNPNYDALLSSTLANYRKQFSDNLSKSFFLLWWLNQKERKRMENGGESIIVQLMYGKNSTIKSYSGYEVLDTTPQEGLTAAKFPWKQVAGSVSISRLEERQNSGEGRIINLLASKVTQAEISMRDSLNAMFFGDGTGNGSRDIFGLGLLVENGTVWGTLAGIDRSDVLNTFWRNKHNLMTGVSFATTGIARMRTMYNDASRGNEHPDIGIADQLTFERYEAKLEANERFTQQDTGDAGFQNLKFKGMVLGYDEQVPITVAGGAAVAGGQIYMLNSRYLEWVVDSETDLVNTEFVRPENQDAKVSQILLMGNLVTSNAARNGVIDGIDTA